MSSNGAAQQRLDDLFPAPSLPPSPLSPQRLPGGDLESLAALRDVLKDNHQRHHIYFNDKHFHNHITHRALAIYALGGSASVIREYYERDGSKQRPVVESPEPITEENFIDHLTDENFYQGYVSFFADQVAKKNVTSVLEEFIFSEKYNFQKGRDPNNQPEMLAHFLGGLVHGLIHVGYGVEFGLKGMLVEGLALSAVHTLRVKGTFPPSLFSPPLPPSSMLGHITNRLLSLVWNTSAADSAPASSKTGSVHAFDIVARILKDDRLKPTESADFVNNFVAILDEYTPIIREHAEEWTIDPSEVERKLEEVVWLSSLVYGAGGLTPNGHICDFYWMHLVTSSLFLPSLIVYLSPRSQVILLRGYLFTVLSWWVMRGRPALDVKSFMTTTSVVPSIPTMPPPKVPPTTETTPIPDPFLPILQSAITHPMDHVVKIQRTFAHYSTLYGTRPAGYFKGTELENAELLDGSLFLRAALLTADYVGWVREGDEPRQFSTAGDDD